MNPSRWNFRAALAVVAVLVWGQAVAQSFPAKPVRLIVPFPPGGAGDLITRPLGQKFTESTGQAVVVENKPGADTIIAMDALAKSPADGYTIGLVINSALTMNPALYAKLPYDMKDFAPIGMIATLPMALVVNPNVPAQNPTELASLIKAQPGKFNIGSGNIVARLAGELFKGSFGGSMVNIMHKGSAPNLTDLFRGDVHMAFEPVAVVLPHVKAGKLRALGVTELKRSPAAPDWPTIAESGFRDFEVPVWYGILAPAGTPRDVVAKLNQEIMAAMRDKDFASRLISLGFAPTTSTPEEYAAKVSAERARWDKLIKQWGIRLD